MGIPEAFMDELSKVAAALPVPVAAAKKPGTLRKIKRWIEDNPGKSGIAAGWMLRGILSGGGQE
jgi:hypothetical protein